MINYLYADFAMLFVVVSYIAIVSEVVKWLTEQL